MGKKQSIHVTVRARPLSSEDAKTSPWKICGNSISFSNNSSKFDFDRIFGEDCKTGEVYRACTKEIVAGAVRGFNGTVFAYGQTNSGKTHTMRGSVAELGVIPLAVRDLFDKIHEDPEREFLLRMSYMEIHNEEINDLLVPEHMKLQIHESLERGLYVAGLQEEIVATPEQVLELMESGESYRHIGDTNMNLYSSRSHTIFRMIIESRDRTEVGDEVGTCDAVRVSVLNLVDLAGSERAAKTGAEGVRLKEGSHINKSLMTLGTVIKKLSEGPESQGVHVPYRDSKLTRILQPSLGGNANTGIICNITLAQIHADETKSSLQFASRALRVSNCAHVNEIPTDAALLKRQKNEIEELRAKLQEYSMVCLKNSASGISRPEHVIGPLLPFSELDNIERLAESHKPYNVCTPYETDLEQLMEVEQLRSEGAAFLSERLPWSYHQLEQLITYLSSFSSAKSFEMDILRKKLDKTESEKTRLESVKGFAERELKRLQSEKKEVAMQLANALLKSEEEKAIWSAKEKALVEAIEEKCRLDNATIQALSYEYSAKKKTLRQLACMENNISQKRHCSAQNSLGINQVQDPSTADIYNPAPEELEELQKKFSILQKEKDGLLVRVRELESASNSAINLQNLQDQLAMISNEKELLKVEMAKQQASYDTNMEVVKGNNRNKLDEAEQYAAELIAKISSLELKLKKDGVMNMNEKAKLRMKLHWTHNNLDAVRKRFEDAIDELRLMDTKYKEAAAILKNRLAQSAIINMNLEKQLVALQAQSHCVS